MAFPILTPNPLFDLAGSEESSAFSTPLGLEQDPEQAPAVDGTHLINFQALLEDAVQVGAGEASMEEGAAAMF